LKDKFKRTHLIAYDVKTKKVFIMVRKDGDIG